MVAYRSEAVNPNRKEIIYRDLNPTFRAHPVTKKLSILENDDAIKRAVRNVILTNRGERFFNPFLGGNIIAHLFELFDNITVADVKKNIRNSIKNSEPRVDVLEVNVVTNNDRNEMFITIIFKIKSNNRIADTSFTVERIR